MRIFFASLTAVLVATAGFTLRVNPGGLWRAQSLPETAAWPDGMVLATPPDFDERAYQAARLERAARPGTLVLGSSRAALLRGAPDGEAPLLNAWVSGALAADDAALWRTAVERGRVPRLLLLIADPETLSVGREPYGWRTDLGAYGRFARERLGARAPLTAAAWRLKRPVDLLAALVTWSAARTAWTEARRRAGTGPAFFFAREAELGPDRYARRADGTLVYPARMEAPKPPAVLRAEAAAAYAASAKNPALDGYAVRPLAAAALAAVLKDARERGTRSVLVAPPYHPAALETLERDRPALLPAYLGALSAAAASSGAAFCDAHDPRSAGCSEDEFYDERHVRSSCAAKVAALCARVAAPRGKLIK